MRFVCRLGSVRAGGGGPRAMRARRAAAVMAAALVAWVPPAVSVAATEAPARPLRLCVDPDWAPYEWLDEDGRHRGIAADLLRLIAKGAGVGLQLVPTATWDESVSFARSGKCDALSFLNETPERRTWLSFTKPYFFDRNVIITRAEHPDIPPW